MLFASGRHPYLEDGALALISQRAVDARSFAAPEEFGPDLFESGAVDAAVLFVIGILVLAAIL